MVQSVNLFVKMAVSEFPSVSLCVHVSGCLWGSSVRLSAGVCLCIGISMFPVACFCLPSACVDVPQLLAVWCLCAQKPQLVHLCMPEGGACEGCVYLDV